MLVLYVLYDGENENTTKIYLKHNFTAKLTLGLHDEVRGYRSEVLIIARHLALERGFKHKLLRDPH